MSTPPPDAPIERLNHTIANILDPNDSRAFSFNAYVKNRIRQFHLASYLDTNEVINEAYARAISAIEDGKPIKHWQAWLKATCFNIVRERSRDRKRHPTIDPQSSTVTNYPSSQLGHLFERSEEEARIKEAQKRMLCLAEAIKIYTQRDPELACLLQLKLVRQWSWQRIREYLVQQSCEEVPSVSTLRKRASRAKTKLRRLYHRIEEEFSEAKISK